MTSTRTARAAVRAARIVARVDVTWADGHREWYGHSSVESAEATADLYRANIGKADDGWGIPAVESVTVSKA